MRALWSRVVGLVGSAYAVPTLVVVAMVARLPALTRPVRADEAGFLIVGRTWDPQPDSMFGPTWVDRPPPLIAVFHAVDLVGGHTALRLLGLLVCGLSVLLAARLGREVGGPEAAGWVALLMTALLSNPMIDVVAVKGELLAMPLLLGSMLLVLAAVRRRSWLLATAAGLVGASTVGLKQNLVGALVFAGVLVLASWATRRLAGSDAVRLLAGGALGAAVPVLATVGWAQAEGVRLSTLWYAVYGFRSDASAVIADGTTDAPARRAAILLAIAICCGLLPVLAALVAHLRTLWTTDPPLTAATVVLVGTDLVGVVLGGSYWQDYLLPLLPGACLCAALLAGRTTRAGRTMRIVVAGSAASAVLAMAFWLVWNATGQQEFDEVHTGEAIAAAAEPGDTLVVFGGRADLQDTSGLGSPYPYLWSLPMRTRDPGYADLSTLLAGPDAPTWLVEWVAFDAWSATGVPELAQVVDQRYVEHGTACNGQPVYLLRGLDRPDVTPDC